MDRIIAKLTRWNGDNVSEIVDDVTSVIEFLDEDTKSQDYAKYFIKELKAFQGNSMDDLREIVVGFINELNDEEQDRQRIDKDFLAGVLVQGPSPENLADDFDLWAVDACGRYIVEKNGTAETGDFGFLTK